VQVEQQRARRVGHVGDVGGAAGEPVDQERVDGAGGQLAALGAGAQRWLVIEHPRQLGAAEVRVEREAGELPHPGLVAGGLERGAGVGGPAVLPDDGVVDGTARARSQMTDVSRWLVMPMAAMLAGATPASAVRSAPVTEAQIASGSCSTQPGCG
jgi:hypothetical protein